MEYVSFRGEIFKYEELSKACVLTASSCTQFAHYGDSPLFNMRNRCSCLSTVMITAWQRSWSLL